MPNITSYVNPMEYSTIDGTQDYLVLCARQVGGSTNVELETTIVWEELI